MRKTSASVGLLALALCAQPLVAFALQPSAPMSSWKKATAEERTDLLDHLVGSDLGREGKASVRKCLDETASAPGHGELPIGEIAAACLKMGNPGQPV